MFSIFLVLITEFVSNFANVNDFKMNVFMHKLYTFSFYITFFRAIEPKAHMVLAFTMLIVKMFFKGMGQLKGD